VPPLRVRILGSGDAFSSGGRLQACFHLDDGSHRLLIDCGASALAGLRRALVDPGAIGWVAISHLHGDHFGGLPWLILDGRFKRRTRPLEIAGPAGTRERVAQAFAAFYPGAAAGEPPFPLSYAELRAGEPRALGPALVTPFEAVHESGAPSLALRIELGGRVIAYSGDTEWSEELLELARGADLFICECSFFDQRIPGHLDFRTLSQMRPRLDCGRLLLVHMGEQMLERLGELAELDAQAASDGMLLEL
jgi:ribonuclease BN (tRNA processing enzyme)